MEKDIIKSAIKAAVKNSIITVKFVGGNGGAPPRSPKGTPRNLVNSGQFKVIGPRVGKGQGGSLLLDLISTGDNPTLIEIGTPFAEELVSIDLGEGKFFGYENEEQIPKRFPTNLVIAKEIKERIKFLTKEKPERVVNYKIELFSSREFLNRKWKILMASTSIGKYGEIRLKLESDDESKTELLFGSHEHSYCLNDIKLYFLNTELP